MAVVRTQNPHQPRIYLQAPLSGTHTPVEHLQFEFMLNAARLTAGFAIEEFEARTGLAFDVGQPPWDQLFADGLLERQAGRIQTTDLGWRHTNEVMARFLPETADAR